MRTVNEMIRAALQNRRLWINDGKDPEDAEFFVTREELLRLKDVPMTIGLRAALTESRDRLCGMKMVVRNDP